MTPAPAPATDDGGAAGDARAATALAGLKLASHLATIGLYGHHRDELYLLACGRRLDWGSLDHAPVTPAASRFAAALFGPAAVGQRVLPALAGTAVVGLTMWMARRLGGTRLAQLLAGACVATAPVFVYGSGVLSTNSFDQLSWTLASALLLGLLTGDQRSLGRWLGLGIVLGVALLNKYTALLWIAGAGLGLLVMRGDTRWRGPLVAVAVAAAIALPNILWQSAHEWPALEFYRAHNQAVRRDVPLWALFLDQPRLINPVSFAVGMIGLRVALARRAPAAPRVFGVLFIAVLAVLLLGHGKPYYLSSAYPALIAVGAARCGPWLARVGQHGRAAAAAAVLTLGAFVCVGTLPVLPERAAQRLGLHGVNRELRQFADWPGLVAQLAAAARVADIPAPVTVLTDSYGTAAAVETFGAAHGLAPPISGANGYYAWGPGPEPAQVVAVGYPVELLSRFYGEVTVVAQIRDRSGLDNRFDFPRIAYRCRIPLRPLRADWALLKHFD